MIGIPLITIKIALLLLAVFAVGFVVGKAWPEPQNPLLMGLVFVLVLAAAVFPYLIFGKHPLTPIVSFVLFLIMWKVIK